MPRLPPSLFRRAARISPHLATLLPACRTIASARAELRWIREHVSSTPSRGGDDYDHDGHGHDAGGARIARLAARRGAGEPLQYVLGTQPFAGLEMLCARGVLIPRPETEAWAAMLAELLFPPPPPSPLPLPPPPPAPSARGSGGGANETRENSHGAFGGGGGGVRILDLCSGTGCIGLALHAHAHAQRRAVTAAAAAAAPAEVFGFDVEPRAVRLARRNRAHNNLGSPASTATATEGAITFRRADVFADAWMADLPPPRGEEEAGDRRRGRRVDVLVSNPPYISRRGFAADTGRAVRNYEPELALVPRPRPRPPSPIPGAGPCAPEDVFYARLLELADALRPRVVALEVGDMAQAARVAGMAVAAAVAARDDGRPRWGVVEIWRDWPDCRPADGEEDVVEVCGRGIPVRGSGHGRVVFLVEDEMVRNTAVNRGFRRGLYAEG